MDMVPWVFRIRNPELENVVLAELLLQQRSTSSLSYILMYGHDPRHYGNGSEANKLS